MRSEPLDQPDFLDYRAIIVVCVSAVVLSVLRFQDRDLTMLLMSYDSWPQEPWRLLSSCLLHGDYLHLGFNLYWTYQLGRIVEPTFGLPKTIGILIFLALISSGGQWAFSGSAVGLSGIVYGLFGLLWMLQRFAPGYRAVVDAGLAKMFVAWFFFCIVATEFNWLHVANHAHGFGALGGLLLGLFFCAPYTIKVWKAALLLLGLTVFIVLTSTVLRPYVNRGDAMVLELNRRALDILVLEEDGLQPADYESVVELLVRATELDESNTMAWHNLAVAYMRLGLMEQAERALSRESQVGK
jgi:membrane associated rhomboid family serine protease